MDHPELVTFADRRIMVGVLANLAAAFLGAVDNPRAGGSPMWHMTDRFRSDLERDLGHAPTDQECYEALEAQIHRLRHSIGEYDWSRPVGDRLPRFLQPDPAAAKIRVTVDGVLHGLGPFRPFQ